MSVDNGLPALPGGAGSSNLAGHEASRSGGSDLWWEDRNGYTYWIVRGRGFWSEAEAREFAALQENP